MIFFTMQTFKELIKSICLASLMYKKVLFYETNGQIQISITEIALGQNNSLTLSTTGPVECQPQVEKMSTI